jgi:hypothetical protein
MWGRLIPPLYKKGLIKMLKAVENLVVANNEGKKHAKQGNHSFERIGNVAKFY